MVKDNEQSPPKPLMFSTERAPDGFVVKEMFPMIQYTGPAVLSKKSFIRRFLDRNRNEYQEVIDSFIAAAPQEANVILGVRLCTTVCQFQEATYLMMTYIGTPAIIGPKEDASTE